MIDIDEVIPVAGKQEDCGEISHVKWLVPLVVVDNDERSINVSDTTLFSPNESGT